MNEICKKNIPKAQTAAWQPFGPDFLITGRFFVSKS